MTPRRRSFADTVMFAFAASVMLRADLAPTEVAVILAVLLGAALLELGPQDSQRLASGLEVRS